MDETALKAFMAFCEINQVQNQGDKLLLNVELKDLPAFTEILGEDYMDRSGIKGSLQNNYCIVNLTDICKDFAINPEIINETEYN
ncbi:MAG: hypothetical protein K0R54_1846 [Clostridiaceae bacterium]|jgi:hypothetical protein|nr:hypothetical protein [Clostridiaceae bacterium]